MLEHVYMPIAFPANWGLLYTNSVDTSVFLVSFIELTRLMLFHVLQSPQKLSSAVSFRCAFIVPVKQTVVVAAHLQSNIERLILVCLPGLTPVAFHAPPVAVAFNRGLDRSSGHGDVAFVDDRSREVLRRLHEVATNIAYLHVLGLGGTADFGVLRFEDTVKRFTKYHWYIFTMCSTSNTTSYKIMRVDLPGFGPVNSPPYLVNK